MQKLSIGTQKCVYVLEEELEKFDWRLALDVQSKRAGIMG